LSKSYLLGVLHDATERKHTFRISQKDRSFVEYIARMIRHMGYNAWTYREGKTRNVYVVEFSKKVLAGAKIRTRQDKIDYVRGYFDAEGSVPRKPGARMYIYFAQKNKRDLEEVRSFLVGLGIKCGRVHNPSKRVDPQYWRFFVSVESYRDFAREIGSRHPNKRNVLEMVI
jgi:intein-encoded DNA endonuclease-like protein